MDRPTLDAVGRDLLFRAARTHSAWLDRAVDDAKLVELYDLLKWGPTSANGLPLRVLFLKSREAKERLRPALSPGNVDKTMAAPVTAILAYDTRFYEFLPETFPHEPEAVSWFTGPGKEGVAEETAFRNSSLQGGYFILAARAVGLDCGPMSGFDRAKVDAEFFPDGRWRSNFLCNLGYGDPSKLPPRNPRLPFETACRIL
ncbi:MAG: putative NADH dehydrogenase/NAD(P)H nitroreductase [Geminicoccaceae bacterium]|jgi:3-hydroxypropanoate dehydrogenase|nr:MAG: putative NADH dehydrogenase/NAD(P)H nitroreductase [Geminicoccaceae bacterium]